MWSLWFIFSHYHYKNKFTDKILSTKLYSLIKYHYRWFYRWILSVVKFIDGFTNRFILNPSVVIDGLRNLSVIIDELRNPSVITDGLRNLLVITDRLKNLSVNLYTINLPTNFRYFWWIYLVGNFYSFVVYVVWYFCVYAIIYK